MKLRPAIFAGLFVATAALASAQSRMGPEPIQAIYGANPTTSAPRAQPPPAPPAATTPPAAPAPVAPAPRPEPIVVPPPPAPVVSMPATMESIDNVQKLAQNDRFYLEVVEDRDPKPRLLFVDINGNADFPYLGPRPVAGKTLREVAFETQAALEQKYYKPGMGKVLLMFSATSKPRNQYQIIGTPVLAQGSRDLPTDRLLYVSDALQEAGYYRDTADLANIRLYRPDAPNSDQDLEPFKIDLTPLFQTGRRAPTDMIVQPGDRIFVEAKGATSGFVTVWGHVNNPGRFGLPANEKLTLSQAIINAGGLDQWGDPLVKLIRHDPAKGRQPPVYINVHDVLQRGDHTKDVELHDRDTVVVEQKWFSF